MEIQVAVLCDAATDYAGKLCVLGAFDTIVAPQFPVMHPQCAMALRMLFRKEEEGAHRLKIDFINEDGAAVASPVEGGFEVKLPVQFFFATRNLVLNLQQLQFAKAGQYAVEVRVDDRPVASIPLLVLSRPNT